MSFRELRNLTEMMRALGYPRPISMENFRTPNFELVSDLLYWMVKKYDPSSSITEEIDTEDDRVEFLTQVATEVLAKARIRLNPKRLYAADGFAVKELIKLARVLYEASRIELAAQQEPDDDDDEVSVKSLLGSRVKDPKATRQLASDITQSGAKLYDLLETELDVRDARQQAIRFLDALSTNHENSSEQKFLERSIQDILVNQQDNVELTERQVVELDAEEKALSAKIKKAQADLERSEKRLKSLQHVRPAFMDEYEKLEKELERQYAIYCERFRNLDYLQRELDLHNSREMKKLAENDRSLKKLQKKFRDDELAILRGEQEDQIENSMLDAMENNNSRRSGGRQSGISGSNQKGRSAVKKKAGSDEDSSSDGASASGSGSSDEDSSDESAAGGISRGGGGNRATADGSDSDQVSLADSGELIDNDDSGSEASGSGSGSGSGASGSETNSDSDQDF
ncbi:Clusterin-associated protein 1 [Phytophthora megakarya]|uniref:Clusterin-associated protein 1 n=1 Tax=Phytophthora megakarya TaxID=4795 RepID=A0A225UVI7_9STRA|nr:Clusterin-associated protein 1 [Phytophthora megakarya]